MPNNPPLPPPFPERWPAAYRRRAQALGPDNPLLRSGATHPDEALADPEGRLDPTGEGALCPLPFLVRKHKNRVLVLIAGRCFLHCRFCFRRGQPERFHTAPDAVAWRTILAWLENQPEVEEVILSGGDPLTLPNTRLAAIAAELAAQPHLRRWRIHTRAPVVAPRRVTPALTRALTGGLPLRMVCHANHPAELDTEATRALHRLQDAGVTLANQAVLLAGVNDSPEVLLELFQRLGQAGVLPHYLHHTDRAAGNRRFRVSLRRGLASYRTLERCAAEAGVVQWVPPYVVDLPSGAGKCRVDSLRPVGGERRGGQCRQRYRWVRPAGWDSTSAATACEWWDIWEPGHNAPGLPVQEAAAPPTTHGSPTGD